MEDIGLFVFVFGMAGAAAGAVAGALWWALGILFGFPVPGEEAWVALAIIGAIALPASLGIAIFRADR